MARPEATSSANPADAAIINPIAIQRITRPAREEAEERLVRPEEELEAQRLAAPAALDQYEPVWVLLPCFEDRGNLADVVLPVAVEGDEHVVARDVDAGDAVEERALVAHVRRRPDDV